MMQKDWPTLASLVSPEVLAALPSVGLGQSLHDTARTSFADEALQPRFSFQSASLGMSPQSGRHRAGRDRRHLPENASSENRRPCRPFEPSTMGPVMLGLPNASTFATLTGQQRCL
jgi:hypothetical protein